MKTTYILFLELISWLESEGDTEGDPVFLSGNVGTSQKTGHHTEHHPINTIPAAKRITVEETRHIIQERIKFSRTNPVLQ